MIKIKFKYLLIICLLAIFSCEKDNQNKKKSILPPKSDSVKKLIKTINQSSKSKEEKKQILDETYLNVSKNMPDEHLKAEFLSKIAYQYYKINDSTSFKKSNKEAVSLAKKLKDSLIIADTYWNYANFYRKQEVYDKAYSNYFSAHKYFENLNQEYLSAKMLYGMAQIKNLYRDYLGSEVLIMRAIKKYKKFNAQKSLYASYNLLSSTYKELKDFERALYYRNAALGFLEEIKNKGTLYEGNLNNLGLIYIETKEYDIAISKFNEALSNKQLKEKNPILYSKLIDNRAYSKLLNENTIGVEKDLLTALKIRENIQSRSGIVINKIHLSDYYKESGDINKAKKLAEEANALARKFNINEDYLLSLDKLSKLDKKKSNFYLSEYIRFSDSLSDAERKVRNKFARIDYETDEYIEENMRLAQQRLWLLFSSFGILLTITILFYAVVQKSKNKSLELETKQQRANEQIYILTLRQQTKLEEGRMRERYRLAEELHDGVLGKLFGTRVGLGFLELKGNPEDEKQFKIYQDELQEIEKEIRAVSHDLKGDEGVNKIGFVTLVNKLIENKSKIGNFTYKVKFSKYIDWNNIEEQIRVNLFRILQEGLQNIIKYANATEVKLIFALKDNNIAMTIKDNGVGFKVKRAKNGIGLLNMSSRMDRLKGSFDIKSEPEKGTTIRCIIPLKHINYEGQKI